MENTKILIKSDKQLLLDKLFQYGSIEKKENNIVVCIVILVMHLV